MTDRKISAFERTAAELVDRLVGARLEDVSAHRQEAVALIAGVVKEREEASAGWARQRLAGEIRSALRRSSSTAHALVEIGVLLGKEEA